MPMEPPPDLASLSLADIARLAGEKRLPPVAKWTPRHCGTSAMRIAQGEDGPRPYLHVRGGLEALVARGVYYEIAERALAGDDHPAGVWSNGTFFALEPNP